MARRVAEPDDELEGSRTPAGHRGDLMQSVQLRLRDVAAAARGPGVDRGGYGRLIGGDGLLILEDVRFREVVVVADAELDVEAHRRETAENRARARFHVGDRGPHAAGVVGQEIDVDLL